MSKPTIEKAWLQMENLLNQEMPITTPTPFFPKIKWYVYSIVAVCILVIGYIIVSKPTTQSSTPNKYTVTQNAKSQQAESAIENNQPETNFNKADSINKTVTKLSVPTREISVTEGNRINHSTQSQTSNTLIIDKRSSKNVPKTYSLIENKATASVSSSISAKNNLNSNNENSLIGVAQAAQHAEIKTTSPSNILFPNSVSNKKNDAIPEHILNFDFVWTKKKLDSFLQSQKLPVVIELTTTKRQSSQLQLATDNGTNQKREKTTIPEYAPLEIGFHYGLAFKFNFGLESNDHLLAKYSSTSKSNWLKLIPDIWISRKLDERNTLLFNLSIFDESYYKNIAVDNERMIDSVTTPFTPTVTNRTTYLNKTAGASVSLQYQYTVKQYWAITLGLKSTFNNRALLYQTVRDSSSQLIGSQYKGINKYSKEWQMVLPTTLAPTVGIQYQKNKVQVGLQTFTPISLQAVSKTSFTDKLNFQLYIRYIIK